MATTKEKWQEIANRGLQDKFDPATRFKFDEAVSRGLISLPQQLRPEQAGTPIEQDFIPTEEALAVPAPGLPERTLGETVTGLGEAALTIATGATGGALGFLGGTLEGAAKELTGQIPRGEGLKIAQERASALTFEPRGEVGKEIVGAIGETLGALPPVLGATPIAGLRSVLPVGNIIKKAIPTTKRKQARTIISNEIRDGNINAGNIAKTLDSNGNLITNKNTQKAIKLLGKGDEAYSTAINFEKMNKATRIQVNKMLDIIESNKKSGDPVKITENRPVNVIGESIAKRVEKLDSIKKKASKDLGEVINGGLGRKKVDVESAKNSFIESLNEADISIVRDIDGNLVADTSRTLTNIKQVIDDKMLNNILNRISTGKMSAKEAHKVKRNLREMVSFDSSKPGSVKVSIEIENTVKKLASELGESISNISSKYRIANKKMSESIDTLKKADSLLGNKLMIGDDLAVQKFASLSKRIATNLSSKEAVIDLIQSLDESLSKRGIRPKGDIKRQVAAIADLEKIFKIETSQAAFGFQSRIAQGAAEAAVTGGVSAGQLVRGALDKFTDMSKLEFDDKMKALRALSKVRK